MDTPFENLRSQELNVPALTDVRRALKNAPADIKRTHPLEILPRHRLGPTAPGRVCLRYSTPILAETVVAAMMATIAATADNAKPRRRKPTASAMAVLLWEVS